MHGIWRNHRWLQSHLRVYKTRKTSTCNSVCQPKLDKFHDTFGIGDFLFDQPDDVNILLGILSGKELLPGIEEIEELSTVNFVEGNPNG